MIKTKSARLAVAILFLVTLACSNILPQYTPVLPPTSAPTAEGGLPSSEAAVPRVSLADAKAAIENGEAVVVDVRTPDAFAASHIAGAISIPLGQIELDPSSVTLEKDQWIITYCTWQAEHSSARAAFVLLHNGFTHVTPILGGFAAWENAGYAVEP